MASLPQQAISRRQAIKYGASAAGLFAFGPLVAACATAIRESPSASAVVNAGEIFDSGGATLRLAMWGGFWQELTQKLVLDEFAKDYNCTIEYDGTFPWYPKMVAAGVDTPAFDVVNMNGDQVVQAKDFFVPQAELMANVAESANLWDFAKGGQGLTWGFGLVGYAFRTDTKKPTDFKSIEDAAYDGKRGAYTPDNGFNAFWLPQLALEYGANDQDLEAAIAKMKELRPWKVEQYSGTMTESLQRGEVSIVAHYLPEIFKSIDDGLPLGWLDWSRKGVLDQTLNVQRNSPNARLAYALVQRYCSKVVQERYMANLFQLPTNSNSIVTPNLATKGIENTAEAWSTAWIPDYVWYNENRDRVTELLNEVYGA